MLRISFAIVASAAIVAGSSATPAIQDDRVALNGLLVSLGGYASPFEREFSSAVAEERYVQLIRTMRGRPSWPPDERALEWHPTFSGYPLSSVIGDRRQLLSDVLLTHTPQGWIGYRDVAAVDGRRVRGRGDRVSRLFLSTASSARSPSRR